MFSEFEGEKKKIIQSVLDINVIKCSKLFLDKMHRCDLLTSALELFNIIIDCPLCTYRGISIMREARTKLRLIKPEDMDMDIYLVLSETSENHLPFAND